MDTGYDTQEQKTYCTQLVDCVWNVMAHAQKPDFVAQRIGRVHLNRRRSQFGRLPAAEVCVSAVNNAGYTKFRGSVKSTDYSLDSPVSLSLPLPCVTMGHHISTGLYTVKKKRNETKCSIHSNFWLLLVIVFLYIWLNGNYCSEARVPFRRFRVLK